MHGVNSPDDHNPYSDTVLQMLLSIGKLPSHCCNCNSILQASGKCIIGICNVIEYGI